MSAFQRELEFRANFIAKMAQNAVWLVFIVLVLLVIYRNTNSVAGWQRGDAFVLAATCYLIYAITNAFFISLSEIPEQVRKGTLDFVLTKPIDSQFWISMRRFGFNELGTAFAGMVMIGIGLILEHLTPDLTQWLAYILLTFSAVILFYSFNLILMTLGIWLVRVDNLWVLSETIIQVSRYPLDIYSTTIQRVLIYWLPLGLLGTIPTRQLIKGFDPMMLGVGLVWALGLLLFARLFWKFALKHYSSASS